MKKATEQIKSAGGKAHGRKINCVGWLGREREIDPSAVAVRNAETTDK